MNYKINHYNEIINIAIKYSNNKHKDAKGEYNFKKEFFSD